MLIRDKEGETHILIIKSNTKWKLDLLTDMYLNWEQYDIKIKPEYDGSGYLLRS